MRSPAAHSSHFGFRSFLTTLLLSSFASLPAQSQAASATPLQNGDRVLIQVKNEPALSGAFTVTPEGTILMPLIGLVHIANRPFAEFEDDVRAAFALELADPEMVITPYRRISILGEVRQPGYQWMEPEATLADALILSGGMLPTARRKHVILVRDGQELKLQLEAADGQAELTPLQSGDRLVIERRSWLSENLAIFVGAAASVAAAAVTSLIVR